MMYYILVALKSVSDFGNLIQLQDGDFGALLGRKALIRHHILRRSTTNPAHGDDNLIELSAITPRGSIVGKYLNSPSHDSDRQFQFKATNSGKYRRLDQSEHGQSEHNQA